MSSADLEALRATLLALPAEDVVEPSIPVANLVQEAHTLSAFINAEARAQLLAVGASSAALESLPLAENALREAQSQWTIERDRNKAEAQKQREVSAALLRTDLVAGCRWNLRADNQAQATLDAIQENEGVPDLIQDLSDLAVLIDKHVATFANDSTFDPVTEAERARSAASELRAGMSTEALTTTQAKAKDLRDRAYTFLTDLLSDIRQAGRYAFRRNPAATAQFQSAYRKTRRKAQSDASTPSA